MTKISKRVYKRRNPIAKELMESKLYKPKVVPSGKSKLKTKITVQEATRIFEEEKES